MTTSSDIFLAALSFLFPPLGVWVKRGLCSCDSLLNILLCLLGYIPGLIHAWYIIAKYPDEYERIPSADERGPQRVVYVSRHDIGNNANANVNTGLVAAGGVGAPDGGKAQRKLQRGPSYGATGSGAGSANQGSAGGAGEGAAEGSAGQNAPPSYAEAVKGDHKIQT